MTFRRISNTAQHKDASEVYPTSFDIDLHRCVNWNYLDSWAAARMFNLYEIDLLDRQHSNGGVKVD